MNKLNEIRVMIPEWLQVLDADDVVIAHIFDVVKKATKAVKTMEQQLTFEKAFDKSPYFEKLEIANTDQDKGILTLEIIPHEDLYYRVMSNLTGVVISEQADLLGYISTVAGKKKDYDRMQEAIMQLDKTGYGVVSPSFEGFELEKPQLYKSGKNFGVKLKATGQSIHLVRVDVTSEVAPIIGEQTQSEDMLKFLQSEYETNKQTV